MNKQDFKDCFETINTLQFDGETQWHIKTDSTDFICARPTATGLKLVKIPIEDESKVVFNQIKANETDRAFWFSILLNYYRSGLTRKGYYNKRLRWYSKKISRFGSFQQALCYDWYLIQKQFYWQRNYRYFFEQLQREKFIF